jgi:pimeloyl-ACP methyl ester carboxylesterase
MTTTTSVLPDVGVELREGYAQVGNVNLHYVEVGQGPLVVLLHGSPSSGSAGGCRSHRLRLLRSPCLLRGPDLPEHVVHANDWHFFRHFLHDATPYTPEEIERYFEAWSQPGAAAGMINYYRASVRSSQKEAAAAIRPLSAPTLVIWGEDDAYLGSDLAEPERDDVPNPDRVERLAGASHWVHHDEADRVNRLLSDFFAAAG